MFHLQAVPFSCPYHQELLCPVSLLLTDRDPDRQSVGEALPCQVCPHFLAHAQDSFAQRRIQIGPVGRQILDLTCTSDTVVMPLSAALRTQCDQRVDLRRIRKAVQALADLQALRTFRLPAVVPRADDSHHLVLRDTMWVQVTAVGKMLRDVTFGQHGAAWRKQHQLLRARLHRLQSELAQVDLFAVYIQQLVALVTQVTQHIVAATDPVMVAHCTAADSPYVSIFVHLEAIAPTACAELQQSFLRAQDARRRSFTLYRAAERRHRQGHNATPETSPHGSGVEL